MNNKEVKLNYNLGPTLKKGGESLLSDNNVIDSVQYVFTAFDKKYQLFE